MQGKAGNMMNKKLQQAIVAARTGDGRTAQALLAQALENDPNNAEAWFLLGSLVESDARQVAYLQKAVALDPGHPHAHVRLAQRQEASPPATLIDADWDRKTAEPIPAPSIRPSLATPADAAEAPLPDWLQELNLEPEAVETPPAPAEEKDWLEESQLVKPEKQPARAPAKPEPTSTKATHQPRGDVWLTRLLFLLIIVAVVVLGVLVYLVLTG
jgi:hypothetical protein